MSKGLKPFEKLNELQQQCCTDIAMGMLILGARIPTFSSEIFNLISEEWSNSSGLDRNQCRYALRQVLGALYASGWEYHVTKEHEVVISQFKRKLESGGGNGERLEVEP